jgi:hypothetical protein
LTERSRLAPGWALVALLLIAVSAAGIGLVTLALIKDQDAAVAIPAGSAIGLVVLVAALVAITAVARDLRRGQGESRSRTERPDQTTAQGIVLLLSFALLMVVPAAVIVATVTLLRENDNLFPEFALPIIVIVGLTALLAVLALLVGIFRRFAELDTQFPLGLPQGTIQAVIALSLILIFAVIGVYVFASSTGQQRQHVSTQLLTTISTLVVAVAGFYFGSKSTKEAAEAAVRAAGGGAGTGVTGTGGTGQQP